MYRPVRAARHQRVELRGIEHHLTHWGPESRDPVVLLHGWGDTADTFQFMVDCFEAEWSLTGFDWRGFGQTGWDPQGYWFPDYFADLDQLLDRLCPDGPARLVGHSMGGNIAMLYAGIRPDRVRSVINLEGFGLPRSSPADAPGRFREWLHQLREPPGYGSFASFDDLAHLLTARNERLAADRAAFVARCWARPADGGGVRIVADPRHKLVNPYLYRRDEAEACWQHITAPVLLVLAELSEYLPRMGEDGSATTFLRLIPHARVQTLEGVGHMLHHEQPGRVAGLVEAFLREHP